MGGGRDGVVEAQGWRTFTLIWAAQSASVVATSLAFYATVVWIGTALFPHEPGKMAWALSLLSLATAVPTILTAPLAGVVVDRVSRRRVLILANLGQGVCSAVGVVLVLGGRWSLPAIVVVDALSALLLVFNSAAFETLYATLVPERSLARANGMMQTMVSFAGVIAPGVGALVMGALPHASGLGLVLVLDSLTFLLVALVLAVRRIPRASAPAAPRLSLLRDLQVGVRFILERKAFLWLLGTFTLANVVAGAVPIASTMLAKFSIGAAWLGRHLGFETRLAAITTAAGLGLMAGGMAITWHGGLRRRRIYGVLLPLAASGLCTVALGLSTSIGYATLAIFARGFLSPILNAHSQTIWQLETPAALQGRVFSVRQVIAQGSWPLSALLTGWLVATLDASRVLQVFGGGLVVWCLAMLVNGRLVGIERPRPASPQAPSEITETVPPPISP